MAFFLERCDDIMFGNFSLDDAPRFGAFTYNCGAYDSADFGVLPGTADQHWSVRIRNAPSKHPLGARNNKALPEVTTDPLDSTNSGTMATTSSSTSAVVTTTAVSAIEPSNCWKCMVRCPVPSTIPKLNLKKGTTTLGFRFKGGVILAVDSRASSGQYVASQTVQKVLEINDFLLGTMAGGAADCQFWERVLGMECRLWQLRHGKKITIAAASKILAGITYGYRGYGLSMGTMIAGWDVSGPHLYYVDDQGTRIKHDIFSVGSGSIYAYGVLDDAYRWDLPVEEAVDLARRSVFHATYRDGGSGGYISVYHIHHDGWTKISRDDQTLLYDRYMQK